MDFPRMDSNAVPFLVRALKTQDGQLKQLYSEFWPDLPLGVRKHLGEPVAASEVRLNAAAILGNMKSAAKPAIPELLRVLAEDEDAQVRQAAGLALSRVGGDDKRVAQTLIRALRQDTELQVRASAAFALGSIGQGDQTVKDALIEAAIGCVPGLRVMARLALKRIDPEAAVKLEAK
jgi:HEAT repeat protein